MTEIYSLPTRPVQRTGSAAQARQWAAAQNYAQHPVAEAQAMPVLILGETGTGKDALARAVQAWRAQAWRTRGLVGHGDHFAALNCAAITDTLFESELFGYKRGAFTGADRDKPGLATSVREGTLFLDEVGELSASAQAKLLRFLESREVRAIGSLTVERFVGRIVAATHRDLDAMVRVGTFREDLYHRLSVAVVRTLALRDRPEDVPVILLALAEELQIRDRLSPDLRRMCAAADTSSAADAPSAASAPTAPSAVREQFAMLARHLRGNVRHLRALLLRAAVQTSDTIHLGHLYAAISA